MLSIEISLNAVRFARQDDLTVGEYYNSMMDNIDQVTNKRVIAESRLEGRVNRANLKFTNLSTTTSRVSVRNIN
jgi:hypothetical protein